jgi:hypothetical protein
MSLSVSTDGLTRVRQIDRDSETKKISAATGIMLSCGIDNVNKTDYIIALFDDKPCYTSCKLILRDGRGWIGTYYSGSFGINQKSRACRALGYCLKKAGIKIEGHPSLFDSHAGFIAMRSNIKAILKKMRYEGEYTSANVY